MRLKVIVGGQDMAVMANKNHALHSVVARALYLTGNDGQPPENWELRDHNGTLLDTSKRISLFKFGDGAQLYLNVKAGIGG